MKLNAVVLYFCYIICLLYYLVWHDVIFALFSQALTHIVLLIPWKYQKIKESLKFSGGLVTDQWHEMGYWTFHPSVLKSKYKGIWSSYNWRKKVTKLFFDMEIMLILVLGNSPVLCIMKMWMELYKIDFGLLKKAQAFSLWCF